LEGPNISGKVIYDRFTLTARATLRSNDKRSFPLPHSNKHYLFIWDYVNTKLNTKLAGSRRDLQLNPYRGHRKTANSPSEMAGFLYDSLLL
jgi:hypothetical protein